MGISKKQVVKRIADNLVGNYDFDANPNLKQIFNDLTDYYCGINSNLDTKKGIMLMGNIGSGKTTIMKIFSKFSRTIQSNQFEVISIREIERAFNLNGFKGLESFSYNPSENSYGVKTEHPYSICIDDVGIEHTFAKNYGNQINIITELLLDRYELFINQNIKTHITTNLTTAMCKERYNERVYDRLKEMFNMVKLTGESLRK